MTDLIPLIALIGTMIGGLTGLAAIMRSNADRGKTVAEGAGIVVGMLERRVTELEQRLMALEEYLDLQEKWADKIVDLLERSIQQADPAHAAALEQEADILKRTRPIRRSFISTMKV